MSITSLQREHLKGAPTGLKKRSKERRARRSERQQTRAALAQAFAGLAAYEVNPFRGIHWIDDGMKFVRFDAEANDFVEVSPEEIEELKKPVIVSIAEEPFEDYLHPINTKDADVFFANGRSNTVFRWLRTQAGKPWADVYSRLVSRFNHGATFLGHRSVYEYGRKIESDGGIDDFFVDGGMFRHCQGRKSEKHMGTVIAKPAKQALAERMAAKLSRDAALKKILANTKHNKITRRKAKRKFHGEDQTRAQNRWRRLSKKYEAMRRQAA